MFCGSEAPLFFIFCIPCGKYQNSEILTTKTYNWPNEFQVFAIQFKQEMCASQNMPIVKNSIYSNGDLWPNDPKINRVLPLPQGNHVVKFGKDPIYIIKSFASLCLRFLSQFLSILTEISRSLAFIYPCIIPSLFFQFWQKWGIKNIRWPMS